jgi:hypothetical protein
MLQHAVEVSGVVARSVVTIQLVLGEQVRVLAVLLGLVVLLAILHEPAAAFLGETLTVLLDTIGARLSVLALVQLLDKTRVCLATVLPLGVRLWSLL